jgi:ribonuclease P protein component
MQRRHRLVRNRDFEEVHRHGRSWAHTLLVLRAQANGLAHSRFGFVVGRHIGKAVFRNRVKRRLREAVRARLQHIASGWDVVLIARPPIASAPFAQIVEALDSLLARAGLCQSGSATPEASG